MKFILRNIVLTLALCVGFAVTASASTIVYTVSGTGSGTLGGNPFTSALVEISMTGDTAAAPSSGAFQTYASGPISLSVAGFGTTTFTGAVHLFVNQTFAPATVGFGDAVGSILDSQNDAAFATYDLNDAIAPTVGGPFIRPDLNFGTGLGDLNIQTMGDVTYSAVLTDGAVPEPATGITMLIGCIGVAYAMRRKAAIALQH